MANEAAAAVEVQAQPTRALVELDAHSLYLSTSGGGWEEVCLEGARVSSRDASCSSRFVRHVVVRTALRRVDLITPPERGSIAPRAARLPGVPRWSIIIEPAVWETVSGWVRSGGGLSGRTILELARLACVSTSQFAVAIGECIAHVAAEMTWERLGPMRGGGAFLQMLKPLEDAARESPRAGEALVAAQSRGAVLEPYAFL